MAKLYFRTGTMNSSKSAQLLMVRHNYLEQGKTVLIFKSSLDTREEGYVKSRALDGVADAILIHTDDQKVMFDLTQKEQPDCVLVDEVQFMTKSQVDELAEIVDLLNTPVIAYGLLSDFQTKLFPGSQRLIEVGARVEEIKTVCWNCKAKAVHNMRVHNGLPIFHGQQVQVGGNESYRPVCRSCYNKAKEEAYKRKTEELKNMHKEVNTKYTYSLATHLKLVQDLTITTLNTYGENDKTLTKQKGAEGVITSRVCNALTSFEPFYGVLFEDEQEEVAVSETCIHRYFSEIL